MENEIKLNTELAKKDEVRTNMLKAIDEKNRKKRSKSLNIVSTNNSGNSAAITNIRFGSTLSSNVRINDKEEEGTKRLPSPDVPPDAISKINEETIKKRSLSVSSPRRSLRSSRGSLSRRQSFILMKKENKVTFYFNKIIGIISIILGVTLVIVVSYRYNKILNICHEKLGKIADCATPKYYFRNGFLTGTLTCAEDQYVSIQCNNNELKGVKHIKENFFMYSNMKNVTSVTISYNKDLISLPESFSYLKNLNFLNVTGNGNLIKLPYSICALPTLHNSNNNIQLILKDTPLETEIDWSNELLSYAYKLNATHPQSELNIKIGCQNAFEKKLKKLNLANNNLKCEGGNNDHLNFKLPQKNFNLEQSPLDNSVIQCTFHRVEYFSQLSYLNLRNNSIKNLRMAS